jgi:hypothetical protein
MIKVDDLKIKIVQSGKMPAKHVAEALLQRILLGKEMVIYHNEIVARNDAKEAVE